MVTTSIVGDSETRIRVVIVSYSVARATLARPLCQSSFKSNYTYKAIYVQLDVLNEYTILNAPFTFFAMAQPLVATSLSRNQVWKL